MVGDSSSASRELQGLELLGWQPTTVKNAVGIVLEIEEVESGVFILFAYRIEELLQLLRHWGYRLGSREAISSANLITDFGAYLIGRPSRQVPVRLLSYLFRFIQSSDIITTCVT